MGLPLYVGVLSGSFAKKPVPTVLPIHRALAPLLLLTAGCGEPETGPRPSNLPGTLLDIALSHAPRTIAVAYQPLDGRGEVEIQGDIELHAASTMKVPVMIELFRRADAGELDLDQPVEIRNRFASIIDGSPYELSPDDDSDAELYERIGQTMPLRELMRRMIVRSSNLATNILIETAEPARIQKTIEALGTKHMKVLRGVEDGKAFRAGKSNTATAHDLKALMWAIAAGSAASSAACEEMVEILAAQEFNDMIPAGLPAGTRVAHKTGRITAIRHDAAIVYPKGGGAYVLVVLTKGFENPEESGRVITEVARAVHAEYTSAQ